MRQNSRDLFTHELDHIANSKHRPRLAILQRFHYARCHRHAEIGADKTFLELVPINRLCGKLLGEGSEKVHR